MLAYDAPATTAFHPTSTNIILCKYIHSVSVTRLSRVRCVYGVDGILQMHTTTNAMSNYTTLGNIPTRMQLLVMC